MTPMGSSWTTWPVALWLASALGLGAFGSRVEAQAPAAPTGSWDPAAAADYLDGRQAWWMEWPVAARDHGTACLSCHTSMPYALARPALRGALGEGAMPLPEVRLVDDVRKRVTLWSEVEPYYPDQTFGLPKSSESRGTEAILNAMVLADRDARVGQLSDEAREAFQHMWDLQFERGDLAGRWAWLYFDLAPWESEGAGYFGAALAAVAVGTAPEEYAASPGIQERLELLRAYLLEGWEERSSYDRVMLLWASSALPGRLLMPGSAMSVVEELARLQRDDGGWSLSALGPWEGRDGFVAPGVSDGYATALIAFVLQRAGVGPTHPVLARALGWLDRSQHPSGRWPATSLNRARDPESERGLMMSDVATAFAVLALTAAQAAPR